MLLNGLIKRDKKAYDIWFHRIWFYRELISLFSQFEMIKESLNELIKKDQESCQMFLKLDERNFHVWNYVHLLNGLKRQLGIDVYTEEGQLKEIDDLIAWLQNDFSNYSAMHFLIKKFIGLGKELVQKKIYQEKLKEAFEIVI